MIEENIELYHYTSLESLKSIIENRSIRFSDCRFVNDINEFNYSINNFLNVIEEYPENEVASIKQALLNLQKGQDCNFKIIAPYGNTQYIGLEQYDNDTKFYIFSLTKNPDALSMWKMYGENGIRIKINNKAINTFLESIIRKYLPMGIINIADGFVDYSLGTDFERNIVNLLLRDKLNGTMLYDTLYRMCLLRKDNSFSYENEYRIGLKFFDKLLVNNNEIHKVFFIRNGTLIPQIEFKNLPIGNMIDNIMISPYNKSDRAELGLRELLMLSFEKEINVLHSKINIR